MNTRYLKLFVRIATTHNISQAGAEMDLSPAVASNYINKLEESLGVRLLHRTTRKVSLTEEGHAFLHHAEDVIASIEAAKASVGAGNLSPSGTLRVAAPASFGRMHIVPALAEFMSTYPDLKVDLKLSDTIVDLVEGGFDVAIRNSALKDSTLIAKKLVKDRRILCASPNYVAKYGLPTHPDELKHHNCLTLMNLDHWRFQVDGEDRTVKVSGSFRTDNGEAIRDACANGLGLTINSSWSAYQLLLSGELIEVLPEFPLSTDAAIWAIYPSSRQLAPKVRAFIDYFAEHFSGEPNWERAMKHQR